MKTSFKNRYVFVIFVGFLLPMLVSCEKQTAVVVPLSKEKKDSIAIWIKQSKNKKLPSLKRSTSLQKAYNKTTTLNADTTKIKYYAKIAYQSEAINSTQLFKEVNLKYIELATKLRDTFKIGDAHWNYGAYYSKKEVIDSAYFHFNKAYEQFKLLNIEYYEAKMLYNMANIQGRIKDYTGSEILIFQAIDIFKKEDKYLNLYRSYNFLGLIYIELEEFDKAILYNNKALEYLKKITKKRNYKEGSLSNLGLAYQKQKNYSRAIKSFKEALLITKKKAKSFNFYARLLDNIAYTKLLSGDTTHVLSELNKSLKIRDSVKNITGTAINKMHLSEYYAIKQDTLKSVQLANEAYKLAEEVENNGYKLKLLLLLSKIDTKNAKKYLVEYVYLNDSLQIEDRKVRNKFTRIRFETDEYIEETEKLSQQKIVITTGAFFIILILSLAYFARVQRNRNKELIFEREQQKTNEEIFSLMLKQQSKLAEGRLKERHRISEDLHDGILGKIFGTRVELSFLDIKADNETQKKYQLYLDELQNIEKEIRTISHELKNEILSSKEDFFNIIEDLIKKKSNLGKFEYQLNCDNELDWNEINNAVKINFYRIIQEALQNIIKYAEATTVEITIKHNNNNLELLIIDDGKGFDTLEKRKGIGIKNMLSRAQKLNGIFEINSTINKGTTIFVVCSIQN